MIALKLGLRSVVRQGWSLLQVVPPTALLFAMITFVISSEMSVRALVKPGVTERTIRLGSVDGYDLESAYFQPAEVHRLAAIPGLRAGGANFENCYVDADKKFEFSCAAVTRVYEEARDYAATDEDLRLWDPVKNGAMLAGHVAVEHGWKVGDHIKIHQDVGTTTIDLDLVVTSIEWKAEAPDSIVVHQEYSELLSGKPGRYWVIWMLVDKAEQRSAVMEKIDADLNAIHRVHTLRTGEDTNNLILSGFETIRESFKLAALLSLGLAMFLSGTMLVVSIEQRKTQFAAMIAIGFRRAVLVRIVLVEGLVLLFSSSAIGAFTMWLLFHEHALRFGVVINVKVPLVVAVLTALGGLVLGCVTALVPSWRLYRLDTLSSLR